MNASVKQSVGTLPIAEAADKGPVSQLVLWANGEAMPIMRKMRDVLNASYRVVAAVRTTDATATVIWSATLPLSCAWSIDADVVGYATDGSAAAYRRLSRYKRVAGAAPVLLGTDTIGTDREDVGAWTVTVDDDTVSVVRLKVTGDATRTVDWVARVILQESPMPQL